IPSAFPDPWNQLSGFDYTANSEIVDAISCKHYTMHWPMMMKNYSDALTEKNPNLSDSLVAESLSKSFGAVSPTPSSTEEFSYPEPNEKHPVSLQELGNKQTIAETNSTSAPVLPIAHSYGPTEDFINRAKAVYSVSKERLWVNRYAYLSDEKLEALGQIFR
ncbi:MAG: hypothetical protein HN763_09490, partial [Opitutales bacterium]|nr:hypothetical protein [Opitutales bacterium]